MGVTPWVRHEPARAMNKKLRQAGFAARGLDDAGIDQCAADDSDGYITVATVEALAVAHGEKNWRRLVKALCDAGRWVETEGGWLIHDYQEFNKTRAYWAAERAKKVASGRAGGKASGQARGSPPGEANASARGSPDAQASAQASAQANAEANGQAASFSVVKANQQQGEVLKTPAQGPAAAALIATALNILADRRMTAKGQVKNPAAYRKSVLTGLRKDHARALFDIVENPVDNPDRTPLYPTIESFSTPIELANFLEPPGVGRPLGDENLRRDWANERPECDRCGGSNMVLDDNGNARRCDHQPAGPATVEGS